MPNHYETLDLPTNASAGDIKKQFYKLSKANHPDLHPSDNGASQRFVKISEAYATLGSPEKRQRYDRDFLRTQQPSATYNTPKGSFSFASTPAGGRPASGLSRRRTQFRGPPPSFYRSGGYGDFGDKREDAASKASHTHEAQGQAQSGPQGGAAGMGPGMGPGGFTAGFDNDVPHFDQKGHYATHNEIERTRHKARRRRMQGRIHEAELEGGTSHFANFVLVCGVLGAIIGVPVMLGGLIGDGGRGKRYKVDESKSQT